MKRFVSLAQWRKFSGLDLADNEAIEVDLSPFPVPLAARWFDPVRGRYIPRSGPIENKGMQRLVPPAKGDWVLLLQ